jgi:hypothetical protein
LPPPEHQLDDSDQTVLLPLADQPFTSIHELSRLTHPPRTTVHRRLTQIWHRTPEFGMSPTVILCGSARPLRQICRSDSGYLSEMSNA